MSGFDEKEDIAVTQASIRADRKANFVMIHRRSQKTIPETLSISSMCFIQGSILNILKN